MIVSEFEKLPILGILRGISKNSIVPLASAIVKSGLKTVEITMNTENAPQLIKEMVLVSDGRLAVGAGTVLGLIDLENALNAGASFIVMPVIQKDVMEYCVNNNIPVFPGALTPNEIFQAWEMGATMVKVFPAKVFGPAYFKEVKAPLNNLKLMATGGVSTDNLQSYFHNGANAISFGSGIFKPEWIADEAFQKIEDEIVKLIQAYNRLK